MIGEVSASLGASKMAVAQLRRRDRNCGRSDLCGALLRCVVMCCGIIGVIVMAVLVPSAHAQNALLELDMLGVESTGITMDCLEEGDIEAGCIPSNVWYIYEARVRDVIAGNFPEDRVKFALYAHSKLDFEGNRIWYVQMEHLKSTTLAERLGTPYGVWKFWWPDTYVCIDDEFVAGLRVDADVLDARVHAEGDACFVQSQMFQLNPEVSVVDTGCSGHLDEVGETACLEADVARQDTELRELERRFRKMHRLDFDGGLKRDARRQAFDAYDKSGRDFQRYMNTTCAFEASLALEESQRREFELECRWRLMDDRIRMLYRQRNLN